MTLLSPVGMSFSPALSQKHQPEIFYSLYPQQVKSQDSVHFSNTRSFYPSTSSSAHRGQEPLRSLEALSLGEHEALCIEVEMSPDQIAEAKRRGQKAALCDEHTRRAALRGLVRPNAGYGDLSLAGHEVLCIAEGMNADQITALKISGQIAALCNEHTRRAARLGFVRTNAGYENS